MPAIIDKILRLGEGKILRQLEAVARAVNAIEDDFVAMSDEELRRLADWLALDTIRVEPRGDLAAALTAAVLAA